MPTPKNYTKNYMETPGNHLATHKLLISDITAKPTAKLSLYVLKHI